MNLQDHLAPSGYYKIPTVSTMLWLGLIEIRRPYSPAKLFFISVLQSLYLSLVLALYVRVFRLPVYFSSINALERGALFIVFFLFPFLQDIPDYLKGCKFLPKLNNEIVNKRNSTYKERFAGLENLVLIMVS